MNPESISRLPEKRGRSFSIARKLLGVNYKVARISKNNAAFTQNNLRAASFNNADEYFFMNAITFNRENVHLC